MNKQMRIGLVGYGKMGPPLKIEAERRGHSVAAIFTSSSPLNKDSKSLVDAYIDFSSAEAFIQNMPIYIAHRIPVIVGTTGWSESLAWVKETVEKEQLSLLFAPNFSLGVALFLKIVAHAAELINPFTEYDTTGYEWHHRHKKDSPSGTARLIAETLIQKLDSKEQACFNETDYPLASNALHFSSLRGGHMPGQHSVIFDSLVDTLTLTHEAKGREGFALGAIKAAEWIQDKTGFFTLDHLLKDQL